MLYPILVNMSFADYNYGLLRLRRCGRHFANYESIKSQIGPVISTPDLVRVGHIDLKSTYSSNLNV